MTKDIIILKTNTISRKEDELITINNPYLAAATKIVDNKQYTILLQAQSSADRQSQIL